MCKKQSYEIECERKKLLIVTTLIVVITLVIVIALDAFQQDILLGYITCLGLHMSLAILHVGEHSGKGGTELILCLLMQPFIYCLSLCCQPTKDQLVTQRFPSLTELGPEILWCPFAPPRDQNLCKHLRKKNERKGLKASPSSQNSCF